MKGKCLKCTCLLLKIIKQEQNKLRKRKRTKIRNPAEKIKYNYNYYRQVGLGEDGKVKRMKYSNLRAKESPNGKKKSN